MRRVDHWMKQRRLKMGVPLEVLVERISKRKQVGVKDVLKIELGQASTELECLYCLALTDDIKPPDPRLVKKNNKKGKKKNDKETRGRKKGTKRSG